MRGAFEKFRVVGLIFCCALAAPARQGSAGAEPKTAAEALARYEQLLRVSNDPSRKFNLTTKAAATALDAGEVSKAQGYAHDLLKQAESMRDNWNYGNAIHVANLVLGHIALSSGDVGEAKRLLLEAGRTPGSPQLNNFGPSMGLAKALLAKGERETVVQYLDLCANFWKDRGGKLPEWKAAIRRGEEPRFGVYLNSILDKWRFELWDRLQA